MACFFRPLVARALVASGAAEGGYRPHDIRLVLSPNSPLPDNPLEHIKLSQEDVDTLALFVRDTNELIRSPLYKTCPILHSDGQREWIESISVEFIRSFVTVFRRLYMEKEQGNYLKACDAYAKHFLNKRLTDWLNVEKEQYKEYLGASARLSGLLRYTPLQTSRLIDVFIYTKFAHQPSRQRANNLKTVYERLEIRLNWSGCST